MKKIANLIVYKTDDPDEGEWTPVEPEKVPKFVTDPNNMAELVDGQMCTVEGSEYWYRVEHAVQG